MTPFSPRKFITSSSHKQHLHNAIHRRVFVFIMMKIKQATKCRSGYKLCLFFTLRFLWPDNTGILIHAFLIDV